MKSKSEIITLLKSQGFVISNSSSRDFKAEKFYDCGARCVTYWDKKDNGILLHWTSTEPFRYDEQFPNVNRFHYGKATTNHAYDCFQYALNSLEEKFKLK